MLNQRKPNTMTKQIWRVWIFYMVITANRSEEKAMTQVCPSCDGTHFCDCSSMDLSTIPSGLTTDITGLNLSYNSIEHVRETDLKLGVNLRVLLLESNQIRTIDKESFIFLGKLEHLDLSNNKLTHLSPIWFRHLFSLQHLNIRSNLYTTLGENPLFSNLKNLRYLRLGNNQSFSAIRKQDFDGITVLEQLEIDGQRLKQYESGSLTTVNSINHAIMNINDVQVLSGMLEDLTNSAICVELRHIAFNTASESSLLEPMSRSVMEKLVFKNVLFTDASVIRVVNILRHAKQFLELEVDNSVLQGTGQWHEQIKVNRESAFKVITVQRLAIEQFYLFSDLRGVENLLGNITKATIVNTNVFLVPCSISKHFVSLLYLDLSENLLADPNLGHSSCEGAWPLLQTFNLSQNSLGDLEMTGRSLSHLNHLTHLDISRNNFGEIPESCQWPENLKYLNISGTQIPKVTTCIPQTLEVLDVSSNNLNDFRLKLPHLKELYIAKNKLKTLPDAPFIPNVVALRISRNKLTSFSKEEFGSFSKMKTLDAGDNNFICSCEFLSFIQYQEGIANWPENYICDSPSSVRGQQVKAAQLSLFECHRTLVVSLICILVVLVILLIVILGYKLHVIWYMKMTWAWLQAKRKPKKAYNQDFCYDAFVSYSERDSEWVENLMVQELENAIPPFKLCLHKRDFVPGKWIIDNIIDSIEKSHKTLFVLSEHFVQSEWCKYELEFSHFRLFDENNDSAILILLEPIQEQTIPKRFCKLRKIMNTKTYLEWPLDENQQQIFWNNLKTALKSYDDF
ncbi:toll-like receptor 2 type-2 isoform X1 [Chelonia mydas]|nr:toll-like receptor 2 type-2 isoform X1 [Chelonia mydas]XP_027689279.2 toll-like receptor 2 type-2 isoform X1 [Chelonia mydas]XP_037753366.1 toll-like receptor 2 type-2 isoform X1 [Chelonia mydas]XP_037753367.1 toll-like receptor 2 type-2 isoform X1 [Chelonia mydas]XP_037753368.1 toll-like receptor 2 type-2 isoform X1 [Chelonia mydas]XP_043401796.1 toll-like receptor 2 type-2 isoform X1 [Chelonia mydas]